MEGAKKKHSLHVLFEIEKMLWFMQKSSLPPIPKHVKFPMYFLRVDPCQISTLNWGVSCEAGSENFWTVPCLDGHKIGLSDVVYILQLEI